MAGETILVVEDEEDVVELLTYNLGREGFRVLTAGDGPKGLASARTKLPDLILLDLMLPGMDGLDVCRELKRDEKTARIPVVMVTAKGEESDVVVGLEMGADDYVAKPFSVKVLAARVRAVLRRRKQPPPDKTSVVRVHDLVINPGRHEVLLKGRPLDLTLSELRILHLLASRPGWVMTRDQIVDKVHGEDYPVTDRSVDVQIVGLRRKLGPRAESIETVRGVGYRFRE
jgi:two-component system phosphate regulon response regulator PhoB